MWCLWSAKGGSGCSVIAAAAAVLLSRQQPVLLVDLAGGGLASILGAEPGPVGLRQWMAKPDRPVDALARMEYEVADNLRLLSWTSTGPDRDASDLDPGPSGRPNLGRSFSHLAHMLAADHRPVVVDLGDLGALDPFDGLAQRQVVRAVARRVTLVSRLCYESLVVASRHQRADDVVLVAEPGRALREADVRQALGVNQITTVRWDPAVARAADSGLLGRRLPRPLLRIPVGHHRSALSVENEATS